MKKKRRTRLLSLSAALCLLAASGEAQAPLLWPIQGHRSGENILFRPQEYINEELNSSNLFIGAPEGTAVVAPADGTVDFFSVGYASSLTRSTSMRPETDPPTFDAMLADARHSKEMLSVPARYVTGSLTLRLADGRKLSISGLEGDVPYKTGMKISRGDVLGSVGYAYKAIKEPHIRLSFSKASSIIDPMTPFGLKTSFIPPQEFKLPEKLSRTEAEEDYTLLIDALKEAYPSLYDIVTPEELAATDSAARARIAETQDIGYADFYDVVKATLARIPDSHLNLLTRNPRSGSDVHVPHLLIAAFGDSIRVVHAQPGYEQHLGKRVVAIDGIGDTAYLARTDRLVTGYDGSGNRSYINYIRAVSWNIMYEMRIFGPRTTRLTFADGTEVTDEWIPASKAGKVTPSMNKKGVDYFERLVDSGKRPYRFGVLNDSTGFFGLTTFDLNEIQLEQLADSLRPLFKKPHLIIDVRDNLGGDVQVMHKLLTWFLNAPSRKTASYNQVTRPGPFRSFVHSINYDSSMVLFPDARPMDTGTGYLTDETALDPLLFPDTTLNYTGRLYILTDEHSVSAATLCPATLVRNHRAVTVGRETRSGYHFMTAMKFAQLRLPRSGIMVRIPLTKTVFDTLVTARTPRGRGLLPDYEVPLTYEEIFTSAKDLVLDHALQLIADGRYLGPDPFPEAETGKKGNWPLCAFLGIPAVLLAVFALRKRLPGRRKSQARSGDNRFHKPEP